MRLTDIDNRSRCTWPLNNLPYESDADKNVNSTTEYYLVGIGLVKFSVDCLEYEATADTACTGVQGGLRNLQNWVFQNANKYLYENHMKSLDFCDKFTNDKEVHWT